MKKIFNCIIAFVMAAAVLLSVNWYNANKYGNYYNVQIPEIETDNTAEEVLVRNWRVDKNGLYNLAFDYDVKGNYRVMGYNLASYTTEADSVVCYFDLTLESGKGRVDVDFEIEKGRNEFYVVMLGQDGDNGEYYTLITDFSLTSHQPLYKDNLFFCITFLAYIGLFCAVAAYINNCRKSTADKKEYFVVLAVITAVFLISNYKYFFSLLPYGHDISFHFNRIAGLSDFLTYNSQLVHRVNTSFNSGYGYLNPIMYPELFLYIPAKLAAAGMSVLGALKVFNILTNAATILISYFSFKGISQNRYIALMISVFYTLSTYRMSNVYVRNAVGESLFMTFIPIAVYGLYAIFYRKSKLSWFWLFLGVTGIVQSHILGCVLTVIILISWLLIIVADKAEKRELSLRPFVEIIFAAGVTVCVNIWFIIPVAYYYLVQPLKLFAPFNRFYDLIPDVPTFLNPFIHEVSEATINLPVNLGWLTMLGIIILFIISFAVITKSKNKAFPAASMLFLVFFMVIITDLTPYELVLKFKPISALFSSLQFTFRFHSVVLVLLCATLAHLMPVAKENVKLPENCFKLLLIPVLAFSLVNSRDFFNNSGMTFYYTKERYVPNDAPNEYFMEAALLDPERGKLKKVEESENITLTAYDKNTAEITFSYQNTDGNPGTIKLPLFYYYGYRRETSDGRQLPLYSGENGAICLELPGGIASADVRLFFDDGLPIFRYPFYFSVVSVIATTGLALFTKKKEKSE